MILYVVTKTSLAALETLCLKDSGTVFSYLLNYDENDSAVELTVTSNYAGNFTFVKIQLSAIWESNIVNPLCHEDRLLLHTVEKVPATRNVRFFNSNNMPHIIFDLFPGFFCSLTPCLQWVLPVDCAAVDEQQQQFAIG